MNPKLLIDAIVQQTTVLIAQLSTAAGVRAPLATIADQIFVELAREIERQGVSRKVAADMFGLALRSYQAKVQRLTESSTDKGKTLWESLLTYIEEQGTVDRMQLLHQFSHDDPQSIGAVLKDLCQTGFLYRTGSSSTARYRAVPEDERRDILKSQDEESLDALIRVAVYRGASSSEALCRQLGLKEEVVAGSVARLLRDGLISQGDEEELSAGAVTIPPGATAGWEAAVFDHFQAMVTAVTSKIAHGPARSEDDDVRGGATLSFEFKNDHPLAPEVKQTLRRLRGELNELWQRVGEHNQQNGAKEPGWEPDQVVTFYFGQSVQELGDSE